MANQEQINLSSYIKSIHCKLREQSESIGFQEAWGEHCRDEVTLKKYANAMKELATGYWQNNFMKNSSVPSRVEWVYKYCLKYFFDNEGNEELLKQRKREVEIANKIDINLEAFRQIQTQSLRVLDVGSCYNPFANYDIFEVLAVDIAPAHPDVKKIDFLNINIEDSSRVLNGFTDSLPSEYFDVVVFSLFLEYLPSPDARLYSCERAYKLLSPEGLLFIITPDSKHVGANAQIMKSWRFILADIGFSRIRYEKLPHIHCMAFRKSLHLDISKRWAVLHRSNQVYDNIYIPQDFHKKEETKKETLEADEWDIDVSSEFPFLDIELNEV